MSKEFHKFEDEVEKKPKELSLNEVLE